MILSVTPEYIKDEGNCSRINSTVGIDIQRKSVDRVMKIIFENHEKDISKVKLKCSKILNQKNLTPLFLTKEEILIPFKARKPIVSRDGSYGYINYYCIKDLTDSNVVLYDNTYIDFMDNKRTVLKRVKMAKYLENYYNEKCINNQEYKKNLNEPATKEDIAILLKELVCLKMSIDKGY